MDKMDTISEKTVSGNSRHQAVDEREAAKLLNLSVATLRAWRHRNVGPRFLRFGRAIRYLVADVEAFIDASRVDTRSAPSASYEEQA